MIEVKAKLWLEKDTQCLIGKGRAQLLQKIKELGSLAEVARSMDMAYSHAWMEIKEIEQALGEPIIVSNRGGKNGGTSTLTALGEKLLNRYTTEKKSLDRYLSKQNKQE